MIAQRVAQARDPLSRVRGSIFQLATRRFAGPLAATSAINPLAGSLPTMRCANIARRC